jgi:hypothetical protein
MVVSPLGIRPIFLLKNLVIAWPGLLDKGKDVLCNFSRTRKEAGDGPSLCRLYLTLRPGAWAHEDADAPKAPYLTPDQLHSATCL